MVIPIVMTLAESYATIVLASVCLITVAGYFYLQNVYSYWAKRGVKGPKPWPFVGNFLQLIINNRLKQDVEWPKKYGKVYGIYLGLRPRLIIADPEVLQQICIKDFDTFPNHELQEFSSKYAHLSLIKLKDEQWKRARVLTSPTFTSSKIKRMFKVMDTCADDLIKCFAEFFPKTGHRKAVVNVKNIYNLFTMDTISSCCFGLKLERAESKDLATLGVKNEFVNKAMRMFDLNPVRIALSFILPPKLLNKLNFTVTSNSAIEPFAEVVRHIINQRRQSGKKYDDYLQSVVDARLSDEMELNEMDMKESHYVGLTREKMLTDQQKMFDSLEKEEAKKTKFTDIEILGGAIFIMAVGLETTGSLLTHCTYALAYHPEVQEKLYTELIKIVETSENGQRKFDYDAITSCRYLDAVLSEALRWMTPVVTLDRVSICDYYLEKYKIHLPKGTECGLAFHAIHNDPDFWPEPEHFDPERFMPGNREKIVPGSYCPFGLGPRHCIGMRFSLTESKLAVAKMVLSYKFEPASNQPFPPALKLTLNLVNLKEPLVTIKERV